MQPLDEEEFLVQYQRVNRIKRVLKRYERNRLKRWFLKGLTSPAERAKVQDIVARLQKEELELDILTQLVEAGRQRDQDLGEGGAGVPAYRRPEPPVLVGAGAKLLPHLDPEPEWRDP